MTKQYEQRKTRLLPNGKPRYIRCYDNNGETADRYTVCFTGHYTQNTAGSYWNLAMNASPFHPQGIGMHCDSNQQIDRPTYSHLGKKISFDQLPEDCQKFILSNYVYLWNITDHPLYSEN
jgi:hypothetical protein